MCFPHRPYKDIQGHLHWGAFVIKIPSLDGRWVYLVPISGTPQTQLARLPWRGGAANSHLVVLGCQGALCFIPPNWSNPFTTPQFQSHSSRRVLGRCLNTAAVVPLSKRKHLGPLFTHIYTLHRLFISTADLRTQGFKSPSHL